MRRAIPYHVTFTGPPLALATLLTYMPSRMGAAAVRACSQIQLLRQTSVDVKCVRLTPPSANPVQIFVISNEYSPAGATSEMWRTKRIGEGSLYRSVRQAWRRHFPYPPLPPLPFFFFSSTLFSVSILRLCEGPLTLVFNLIVP
jgi:hypothetical protein